MAVSDYQELLAQEFKAFKNEVFYPNIVLLGVSGCGKSTLINTIFGIECAKVSDIKPETKSFTLFEGKKYNTSVNLIDSEGYELGKTTNEFINNLQTEINKMERKGQIINCVWFCLSITKKRIEHIDFIILNEISKIENIKNKISIIFTKCDEDDENGTIAREYRKVLKEHGINHYTYEISSDSNLRLDMDKLITDTVNSLDSEDLKRSFIAAQSVNLKLKKEKAEDRIIKYAVAAAGVAITPIPFSDSALLVPLQIKMISDIVTIYGLKNITTLTSGTTIDLIVSNIGKTLASQLLKFIPGIGTILGTIINTSVASSITYGLGKAISEICYSNCKKILNGEDAFILDALSSDLLMELVSKYSQEYNK